MTINKIRRFFSAYISTARILEGLFIVIGMGLINFKAVITDDAYIYYRYVRNIWEGHGPVYNVGEFVEGFTSPLWLLTLTIFGWFFNNLLVTTLYLGLVLGLVSFVAILLIHRKVVERDGNSSLYTPYILALFMSFHPVTAYFSNGLEFPLVIIYTISYGALILLAIDSVLLWSILVALGPVVRPELGVLSLFGIGFFVFRKEYRKALFIGLAFLIFNGFVEIIRIYFYASLLPNTAYVKSALDADYYRGVDYYLRMTVYGVPWFFLFSLGINWLLPSAQRTGRLFLLMIAFVMLLYVTRVGDYFHGRFMLIPGILVFLSFTGVPEILLKKFRTKKFLKSLSVTLGWAAVLPILLVFFNFLHQPLESRDISRRNPVTGYVNDAAITNLPHLMTRRRRLKYDHPEYSGLFFYEKISKKLNLGRPITVVSHPIKASFHSGSSVNFINLYGLTDNLISHIGNKAYLAGHDKWFNQILPTTLMRNVDFFEERVTGRGIGEKWLKEFEVPLRIDFRGGRIKKKVILLNFERNLLENLHEISSLSGKNIEDRIVEIADRIISVKPGIRAQCSQAFFILKKAIEILTPEKLQELKNWHEGSNCMEKWGYGSYLEKTEGKIKKFLRQSHNEHYLWENLKLAIELHRTKIRPYDRGPHNLKVIRPLSKEDEIPWELERENLEWVKGRPVLLGSKTFQKMVIDEKMLNVSDYNKQWERGENLLDGNDETYWHVKFPKEGLVSSAVFDFKEPVKIAGIRVIARKGFANQLWHGRKAIIEGSDDARKWQAIAGLENRVKTASRTFELDNDGSYRFYRLLISDKYFGSIGELEFFSRK